MCPLLSGDGEGSVTSNYGNKAKYCKNIYHALNLFGFSFNNTENQITLWKHKDNLFVTGSHRNPTGSIYPVQQSSILFFTLLLVGLKNVLGFPHQFHRSQVALSLYSKSDTKFSGLVPCQK